MISGSQLMGWKLLWRSVRRWPIEHWREFIRSLLGAFGSIFLALEAFEVLTDGNISMSVGKFILFMLLPGAAYFLVDGYFLTGFLRREVEIPNPGSDTKIIVRFGDIFEEIGWKVVGVNDFFDHVVDETLVSSRSLHGRVLSTYWQNKSEDWRRQVDSSLKGKQGERENRSRGNRIRYQVGTAARACMDDQKFIFVALGRTNAATSVVSANSEMLIRAVRGAVAEGRAACSMEPLVLPLMGSGLARVGMKASVLVDLIVAGIQEECRNGRVTGEIRIVLPLNAVRQVNLRNNVTNWTHVK